jgi:hypothetical protein
MARIAKQRRNTDVLPPTCKAMKMASSEIKTPVKNFVGPTIENKRSRAV